MTREEFRAKWSARHTEWEKLSVMVNGAKMCEEFIADFEDVLTSRTAYGRAELGGRRRRDSGWSPAACG